MLKNWDFFHRLQKATMALSQGNLKSVLVAKIWEPLAVVALENYVSQPYLTNNLAKY